MISTLILLGTLTCTSYRPVTAQTKATCTDRQHCTTSIGDNVSEQGVAISQDLLAGGIVQYGDAVYVEGVGMRIINDTMNARHKRSCDVFVYTRDEERKFGTRHLKVWVAKVHAINDLPGVR